MNHRISLTILASLGFSALASADVTIGGTRSQGMGGAGLALPFDIGNNYRMNPAFLAFGPKAPTLQWPQFGFKLNGISFGDVSDVVGKLSNGGLDSDGVLTLARDYANSNKVVAVNTDFGVQFAGFAIGVRGELGINSRPNQQLQNWAAAGGDTSNVDLGSRLDAYGYGYQQVDIGYGNTVKTKAGKLSIGFNGKRVKSYYAHKFADKDTIQNNDANGVQNGSGIAQDFAESSSYGMDIGLIYRLPNADDVFFGAVIENFIEPGIVFPFEAPGGGSLIAAGGFDPYKRTISAGFGMSKGKLMMAADFIDLGNSAGRQEVRYGAELALTRGFAVRAGYNSRTAFSYGLSLGGLNVQIGGQAPLTLASVIRF